jgi:uncharacterized protein (TIGR02246 family)
MRGSETDVHVGEAALAVVDVWARALAISDVDTIVALYAPDATFIGTSSREIVDDRAGIRAYFEAAVRSIGRCEVAIMGAQVTAIDDCTGVVVALDRIAGTVQLSGRLTFVVARRGDAWKIVSFHRSAMPG